MKFQVDLKAVVGEHNKKKVLWGSLFVLTLAMVVSTTMIGMGNRLFLTAGWEGFKNSLTQFFEHGLGGPGMEGVGIAVAVIGLASAIVSFVVHKFNPQSRMPGWVTCLIVGLFGAIAMGGVSKPLQLLKAARDVLFSWVGL